jgi:hypothetical protein
MLLHKVRYMCGHKIPQRSVKSNLEWISHTNPSATLKLYAEYSFQTLNVVYYTEDEDSCLFCKNGAYLPRQGHQILEKFNLG